MQVDEIPDIFERGIEQFISIQTKAFFKRFGCDYKFSRQNYQLDIKTEDLLKS